MVGLILEGSIIIINETDEWKKKKRKIVKITLRPCRLTL